MVDLAPTVAYNHPPSLHSEAGGGGRRGRKEEMEVGGFVISMNFESQSPFKRAVVTTEPGAEISLE